MDSKFRLNILDAQVSTEFSIKRSKEIQNGSILLIVAKFLQTIAIFGVQLYNKDFIISDNIVRIIQLLIHLITIYINKKCPLRF